MWAVFLKGFTSSCELHFLRSFFSQYGEVLHIHFLDNQFSSSSSSSLSLRAIVLFERKESALKVVTDLGYSLSQHYDEYQPVVKERATHVGLSFMFDQKQRPPKDSSVKVLVKFAPAYSSGEPYRDFSELFAFLSVFKGTITQKLLENFVSEVMVLQGENTCQYRVAELLLRVAAALPANAISALNKYQSDIWSKTMRLISSKQLSMSSGEFLETSISSLKMLLDKNVVTTHRKKTWERRIQTCKSKHRPILTKYNNWGRDRFYDKRNPDFRSLLDAPCGYADVTVPTSTTVFKSSPIFNCVNGATADNLKSNVPSLIDRISCRNLTYQQFVESYEKPEIPVIISDIPLEENWQALNRWTLKDLKRYGRREFKCGEDDEGYKVKIKMKYFLKYVKENTDDSPLYIFDSSFDNDSVSKALLEDFKPPSFFPDDLFSLVGESRRPPYRWFLLGPQRSGTCVHIDPLGTSAWNTVLRGAKRWVAFPPGTPKSLAKALDVIKKGEDDEAIHYFVDFLPRLREQGFDFLEFTQLAGDTVYIPGGWWHAVLNLEDSIAITQNFCSRVNLVNVWRKTRTGRKKMAQKWLIKLREHYSHLADIIDKVNDEDKFVPEDRKDKSSKKKHSKKRKSNDHKDDKEKPEFKRSTLVQNGVIK